MTKRYKALYVFLSILSFCLTIGVLLFAVIACYISNEPLMEDKIKLSLCLVIALILVTINVLCKYRIRSALWFIILGINLCIKQINNLLMITAICTIVDEFIISPLKRHYKAKYVINKEIDKRL